MIPSLLFPISDVVEFQSLVHQEDQFELTLKSKCVKGACPNCGLVSRSRHSKYLRQLRDLPWAGISITVKLIASKFYCKSESCSRKIFTERFGERLKPYERRTKRYTEHLSKIGYALGGNAGAKLALFLGMPVGSSTILRIISSSPYDENISTPRVLGIDDWAFKKGHTYGTILVDLEKRKPIDLLPNREVGTVKDWLVAHPGIEIISRDRASCYSQAANLGAPDAIQVADRWHLLKNLGDALRRFVDKHNQELRIVAREIVQQKDDQSEVEVPENQTIEVKTESGFEQTKKESKLSRYELNFLEVKRLRSEGHSIKSIHRQINVHRQTIKKYLKYDEYPQVLKGGTIQSKALPFEDYLRKRWEEGETNRMQLWREIKEQGFSGSSQSVYRLVCNYPKPFRKEGLPTPLAVKAWSARKVSLLMSKPFEKLDRDAQNYLRLFYKHCPKANTVSQLARRFKNMTDNLKGKQLGRWLQTALESGIASIKNFAKGLQRDLSAVKAAVSLEWSNGQVEGQVNRLKNIKRQMYGRANFQLLRKRVLMNSS